jgi:putative FmdB family regulatory protein
MPIYEYRCDACGHELEKIQRISDAVLTDCPECGRDELRRLVSAPGFRLKGGGWYETDFKKDGKRNLHESHAAKGSSAPDGDAKKPAKPAETKKAKSETASTGGSTA